MVIYLNVPNIKSIQNLTSDSGIFNQANNHFIFIRLKPIKNLVVTALAITY